MAKTKQARGTCSVDGCGEPHKAAGYCNTHYTQQRRGVTPYLVIKRDMEGPETCTEDGCCDPVKAKGLCGTHYARLLRHGHTMHHDRKKPAKACTVEGCGNWNYAKGMCHQHYHQNRTMMQEFGIGLPEYQVMHDAQGGACMICQKQETSVDGLSGKIKQLAVDHCHDTGEVRGLLCNACNRAIGMLKDDPGIMRAAAAYIDRHRCDKSA